MRAGTVFGKMAAFGKSLFCCQRPLNSMFIFGEKSYNTDMKHRAVSEIKQEEYEMKRSMKKMTSIALAGMMALSVTGCGGSEKAAETTKAPAAEATKAPEAAAATEAGKETEGEPVTIKITWWGGQGRHDYTQKLLDAYSAEHPNVTFEAIPSGWDGYFDKLSTQAASGSMPDIVQMDYLYISTFAKNNTVTDLKPFMDDGTIEVADIDEKILNSGKIGEMQAGLPLSSSILAVSYNTEVLEKAGMEAPADGWTWEDYIAMNKAVADANGEPSALAATGGPISDTNIFNYWVRQHGGSLFNEAGNGLGYEDDAITADFYQMWKDMMDENVAPDPDEQAQIATLGYEGLPIVTGTAATTIDWNNMTSRVSSINDKLKLALPPTTGEADSKGLWIKPGMFFSIAETSKVKKEAAEFINWFVNSEEANDIISGERGTPVSSAIRSYMVDSGKLNPQQQDMFDYVDKAAAVAGETPAPDPSGIAEVNEAFANAGNSVFYGQVTAEEAAKTFREEANAILERNNK